MKSLRKKANGWIYMLQQLRPFLSIDSLVKVYNGYIRSLLEYCSPVFINASNSEQAILNSVQCRAHNTICSWLCLCKIFPKHNNRRKQQVIKLFNEALNNKYHILYNNMPIRLAYSKKLKQPYSKTTRRQKSFFNMCTEWVNN